MSQLDKTVVGIDVGGERKGFHAVALLGGQFVDKNADPDPAKIINWCIHHNARVVAVDSPCAWSQSAKSRLAERELVLSGQKIFCFATPTRESAINHNKGFYDWVFNGERLYQRLQCYYQLFDGKRIKGKMCIETFPHAVVCAMAGRVVPAKPKSRRHREALLARGYDTGELPNIDFVDAALSAVAAESFRNNHYELYGDRTEGFIVVPASAQCI